MNLNNAEHQSSEVRKRLRELLEYVEELVRQAVKPVFALGDYNNVLYYESDLKDHVGIQHDLEDEDGPIWLKIERLKRVDPPLAPVSIREWLTLSRDPFREPVIETMRVHGRARSVGSWSVETFFSCFFQYENCLSKTSPCSPRAAKLQSPHTV